MKVFNFNYSIIIINKILAVGKYSAYENGISIVQFLFCFYFFFYLYVYDPTKRNRREKTVVGTQNVDGGGSPTISADMQNSLLL